MRCAEINPAARARVVMRTIRKRSNNSPTSVTQ
jgi:hypothetical protein